MNNKRKVDYRQKSITFPSKRQDLIFMRQSITTKVCHIGEHCHN